MSPELFRDILFSLTGLSFGAAAYALYAYAFVFVRGNDRFSAAGHVLVKISWLLTVGAIFWSIIIPLTAIPPTLEGWIYAAGVVLGFIGFVMVARSERRTDEGVLSRLRRRTDEKVE